MQDFSASESGSGVESTAREVPRRSSRIVELASSLSLRRGVLFLVAIGVPVIVGTLRGEPRGGLIGGIAGLLLSVADTEGGLGTRLRTLILVAGGIAIGAAAGIWLKGLHELLWPLFFLAVFVAGLLNQVGRGPHFATRFCAIAMAVAASVPALQITDAVYFAGAVLLTILARSIDEMINGRLHTVGPWAGAADLERGEWLRFAFGYAIAATIGLWIGVASGSARAVWVSAIVLVIMLPDPRATYSRIFEGVVGTSLAAIGVFLLMQISSSPAWILSVILLTALLIPSQLSRFWVFSGMIAALVLLAYDLALPDPRLEPGLLLERLRDMVIAAGLALVATTLAFPAVLVGLLRRPSLGNRGTSQDIDAQRLPD